MPIGISSRETHLYHQTKPAIVAYGLDDVLQKLFNQDGSPTGYGPVYAPQDFPKHEHVNVASLDDEKKAAADGFTTDDKTATGYPKAMSRVLEGEKHGYGTTQPGRLGHGYPGYPGYPTQQSGQAGYPNSGQATPVTPEPHNG